MAYIEPEIQSDLTIVTNNPNVDFHTLNFKTVNVLRKAQVQLGIANHQVFKNIPSAQQTAIINLATALATT